MIVITKNFYEMKKTIFNIDNSNVLISKKVLHVLLKLCRELLCNQKGDEAILNDLYYKVEKIELELLRKEREYSESRKPANTVEVYNKTL